MADENLWHALNGLRTDMEKDRAERSKARDEFGRALTKIEFTVTQLNEKVGVQNGRVGKAEQWQRSHDERMAERRGEARARAEAILTRGQVATIGLVAGVAGTVAGTVVTTMGLLR